MAYTTINKGSDYFNTKLYTGNGTGQSITGVGFQPDFVWCKRRSISGQNFLQNIVQGTNKALFSDSTSAEFTGGVDGGTSVTSFDSDGFTLGTEGGINGSGGTFASWNWLASNTTASNTDGSITSTVSANTTSGFSIVSYTGNATSGANFGHGLGVKPACVIVKRRNSATNWQFVSKALSATPFASGNYLKLNSTDGMGTNTAVWNTEPTSSLIYLTTSGDTNASGGTYVAYCFAEKKGFSKFGSYTGNGSADGTFVYTGFKPAFLIVKRTDSAGYDWLTYDNKRQVPFNVIDDFLNPNSSGAETTGNANQSLDFLSNGVKFKGSGASSNGSGATYIYMAFAESPFVGSDGTPTTAR